MSGVLPWPYPAEAVLPVVGATPFLGEDLIPYLVLALGAALLVGNVAAMARPRRAGSDGEMVRAPAWRAVPLALVGLVASIWALATLVAG